MAERSIITNRANGELASCSGPHAVNAFRLRTMIIALRFREKTGFDLSRVKVLPVAKAETGLKTNKIPVLIAAIEAKLAAEIDQCEIVEAKRPEHLPAVSTTPVPPLTPEAAPVRCSACGTTHRPGVACSCETAGF
jgi:hypothetical protein